MYKQIIRLFLLILLVTSCAWAVEERPAAADTKVVAPGGGYPSNEDLRHVRTLTDPHISPDGTRVLVHIADSAADALAAR